MNFSNVFFKPRNKISYSGSVIVLIIFFSAISILAQKVTDDPKKLEDKKMLSKKSETDENVLFKEEDFAPLDFESMSKKNLYPEILLEDFEVNNYTEDNMKFIWSLGTLADISIRNDYPAPILGSKRYLGIKIYGKRDDAVSIYPIKPIIIDSYVKNLSIWAYGKGLSGILQVVIRDVTGNTHILSFGQLRYIGWKRLSIKLGPSVVQDKFYTNKYNFIKIVSLVYNPGNTGEDFRWNYVYLDDFSATIRPKYNDRQRDDW